MPSCVGLTGWKVSRPQGLRNNVLDVFTSVLHIWNNVCDIQAVLSQPRKVKALLKLKTASRRLSCSSKKQHLSSLFSLTRFIRWPVNQVDRVSGNPINGDFTESFMAEYLRGFLECQRIRISTGTHLYSRSHLRHLLSGHLGTVRHKMRAD